MHASIKRHTGSAALIASLLVALVACDESAQDRARGFVRRTVPSSDSMPSMPDATRSGQSVSYVWDLETQMSPDAYAAWLRERLTDFQDVESTAARLHFSKLVSGDAYRLSLTIESGAAGGAHVHGQLIVSPD